MGCKDECLNYLGRSIQVWWENTPWGNRHSYSKGAGAPGASTQDAQFLRNKIRGGAIFGAFSDRERDEIWERLQVIEALVPLLFTFSRDIQYLKLWGDCLKRLAIVPRRQRICETFKRKYSGKNQREGSEFKSRRTTLWTELELSRAA